MNHEWAAEENEERLSLLTYSYPGSLLQGRYLSRLTFTSLQKRHGEHLRIT